MALVGIIDLLDTGNEVEAIRQTLEYLGLQTIVYQIGRPLDFIDVISGKRRLKAISVLVICGHGNSRKILMPKLDPSVYFTNEPQQDFGVREMRQYANFSGLLVLTTGCTLGEEAFGKSIIHCKADTFIGPSGYIEGNAALAFVQRFFYEYVKERGAFRAFTLAQQIDEETAKYRFFN